MKIGIEANLLKKLFENVYFINGTAYAGKSTVVHMLAEKHGGIECGENYHAQLEALTDPQHQPNIGYFQTMSGWREFLSRTPEEYDAWIRGTGKEAAELEILRLIQLAPQGKKIFADTNISPELLREISDDRHVAFMLSPQSMSVERFFDRPDAEKQFLYQELLKFPDPQAALANFRACLAAINSPEHYAEFEQSGFFVWKRTETTTAEDALAAVEAHFFG
ncbi:MAG: hypothetical protein Q4A66_00025 [Eubacteriales bacterium]|nr:hypothetical protein [Eubacteriales bacterium]